MKINFLELNPLDKEFTVSASPSWLGVSKIRQLIEHEGQQILIEQLHEDMAQFINFDTLLNISKSCGDLAIGPKVVDAEPLSHRIAYEYLKENWRTAGLHDLSHADVRKNIILKKKQLQSELQITNLDSTFELIETLSKQIKANTILCPKQIVQWQDFAQSAKLRLQVRDVQRVPCHLDGKISNILVNEKHEVMFNHFDFCALSDPLHDVGCYLMEAYELKEDAKQGYVEWFGQFNESHFEWAWLYGMLDDLKWGLIALNLSSTSARKNLEFGKYASWCFLRFEENLKAIAA